MTVTWIVDAEANVHDRVELPEPATLVGVTVQEVLLVARFTRPANPFKAVIVTVVVPAEPARRVTDVGLAVIAKSWNLKVVEALWPRVELVPLTARV